MLARAKVWKRVPVWSAVPPKLITAAASKFVPVAPMGTGRIPPVTAVVGEMELSIGAGYTPTVAAKLT